MRSPAKPITRCKLEYRTVWWSTMFLCNQMGRGQKKWAQRYLATASSGIKK